MVTIMVTMLMTMAVTMMVNILPIRSYATLSTRSQHEPFPTIHGFQDGLPGCPFVSGNADSRS